MPRHKGAGEMLAFRSPMRERTSEEGPPGKTSSGGVVHPMPENTAQSRWYEGKKCPVFPPSPATFLSPVGACQ